MFVGLVGVAESHARPMTAQLDGEAERGPIFFFTARDTALAQALGMAPRRAFATYAAKGHGLFAALHGGLMLDNDRATIDRLWNRFVAAWFEGGKEDPKLALIRFEPESAEIWRARAKSLAVRPPAEWVLRVSVTLFQLMVTSGWWLAVSAR